MWAAKSRSSRIVCSQYRRCQMPRSPRLLITSDRGSPTGNDFANAVLIARHRPGKLASPSGKRPQTVHVVGKDDPGVDMEWRAGAHLPNRVAQSVDFAPPASSTAGQAG